MGQFIEPRMLDWTELMLIVIKLAIGRKKVDGTTFPCNICNKYWKFSGLGFQSLFQRSTKDAHKQITKEYSSKNQKLWASGVSSLLISASLNKKVKAAEAQCMFKVSEETYLLRSRDHAKKLFKTIFCDSSVAVKIIVSQKASYIANNGVGPSLGEDEC